MRFLKPLILLAVVSVFAAEVLSQESDAAATKVGIADIYLAKDDGNGKAGEAAGSFVTTDVPIYCVVQLDSAEPVTVRMQLVAVSVPGVKPETTVVATSYKTRDLQDRVNFTGRPQGQWVAGRYRVDIFIDDMAAGSREFAVQKPTQAKPSERSPRKPAEKSRLAGPVKKANP
jgi:hypothetical protein